MTETAIADARNPRPKRPLWATLWKIVGRLAIGWFVMCMLVFGVIGGLAVAYLDLTGPHCDQHLMGPADTCSTLTSRPGRSQQTIERLNPAGVTPVELAVPANWHAAPGQLHTYVRDQAGMREFHRATGLGCLAMAVLFSVLFGRVGLGIIRAKRSPRTDDSTSGEPAPRT